MNDLFNRQGIHLSFLRQPMGASDLALSSYTYDDLAPGETDPDQDQFSLAHDQAYILPTIRAALGANPDIKVMALPWSPPAWMKTNDALGGGGFNTANFSALSKYFAKFIAAYEANGVPINYVAVQNEPLYETGGFSPIFMKSLFEGRFLAENLAPELRNTDFRQQKWHFTEQD